jgi:hypothetical protein
MADGADSSRNATSVTMYPALTYPLRRTKRFRCDDERHAAIG